MHRFAVVVALAISCIAPLVSCTDSPAYTPYSKTQYRTTDGDIALQNLQAQLKNLQQRYQRPANHASWEQAEPYIHALLLRAEILGKASDYVTAEKVSAAVIEQHPNQPQALQIRARVLSAIHRYAEALEILSHDVFLDQTGNKQHVGIYLAQGNIHAAQQLQDLHSPQTLNEWALKAQLHAEHGDYAAADAAFAQAQAAYQGVSPFPLAWLYTTHGRIYMQQEEWETAEQWFTAALERVPGYVVAIGLRAEVQAEQGQYWPASEALGNIIDTSEDPDYQAQLARIMADMGFAEASQHHAEQAAGRFDQLLSQLPHAYAEHAAEFWLAAGKNPQLALQWAQFNAEQRQSQQALALLAKAQAAVADD